MLEFYIKSFYYNCNKNSSIIVINESYIVIGFIIVIKINFFIVMKSFNCIEEFSILCKFF